MSVQLRSNRGHRSVLRRGDFCSVQYFTSCIVHCAHCLSTALIHCGKKKFVPVVMELNSSWGQRSYDLGREDMRYILLIWHHVTIPPLHKPAIAFCIMGLDTMWSGDSAFLWKVHKIVSDCVTSGTGSWSSFCIPQISLIKESWKRVRRWRETCSIHLIMK